MESKEGNKAKRGSEQVTIVLKWGPLLLEPVEDGTENASKLPYLMGEETGVFIDQHFFITILRGTLGC